MPLQDLAHAIPGILVAALLPGFALATLCAPRWRVWERAAAAPGLSAGFLGVLGLGMRLVHVPFEPLTVLPVIAAVAAAAIWRVRREAGSEAPRDHPSPPWWLPVPALVAGLVGAIALVIALHGQVLPPDWDSAAHGGLANGIAQSHDVLPLIPVPLEGTLFARARPGFEAMAAVVSWVGGPSPAASMVPIVTVTLCLLPLGIAMLAFEATGSLALAAVSPLFALGMAFPADQVILGRFPQVVDSTLVAPLLVAVLRALRDRRLLDNALLIGALIASIWVIHGLEIFTMMVVGGTLLAAALVVAAIHSPRRAAVAALSTVGAAAAGALLVTVLTRLPKVPPPAHPEPSAIGSAPAATPVDLHSLFQLIVQTDLGTPVALGLACAGVAAVLVRRRLLWVLASEVLIALVMIDNLYLHHLASLWRRLYPFGDPDRLAGLQYWLIPLLLGAGLIGVVEAIRAVTRRRRLLVASGVGALALAAVFVALRAAIGRWWVDLFGSPEVSLYPMGTFDPLVPLAGWRPALAVTALALVVAWVAAGLGSGRRGHGRAAAWAAGHGLDVTAAAVAILALVVLGAGARADLGLYQRSVVNRGLVTPADLTVLNRMSALLPRGALVLTDGNDDAGMWMAAVTDLTPVVPNSFEGGPLGTPLVVALQNACSDPAAAVRALTTADAVFVGAHRLPAAQHPWDVDCIARLPGLHLIASEPWGGTEAAAFAVER